MSLKLYMVDIQLAIPQNLICITVILRLIDDVIVLQAARLHGIDGEFHPANF